MQKPQIILASVSIGRKHLLEKLGVDFEIIPSTIDEDNIIHSNPIKMLQMRSQAKADDVVSKIIKSTNHLINKSSNNSKYSLDANSYTLTPNYLIIAADSMAILNGKTFGKAKNKAHAKEIISELMNPPATPGEAWRAGKTHEFVTATSIVYLSNVIPNSFRDLNQILKPTSPAGRQVQDDKKRFNLPTQASNLTMKQWNNLTSTQVTFRKLSASELDEYTTRYDFTRFAAGYALNETPWDLVTKIEGSYTNVIGLPFEIILPIFRKYNIM